MNTTYSTPFTKALLTGLFVGIVATLLCIGYDIAFRESISFSPTTIINVSSMIFVINLLFLVIGVVYYGFLKLKHGELGYIIISMAATTILIFLAFTTHRSSDMIINNRFHHLLAPIVAIIGLCSSIGIPLLWHSRKFEQYVI